MTKVFIDGNSGTTGLQIEERLKSRHDLELLKIAEDKRKDTDERKRLLNLADIVFLCLPDAAAKESVSLIDNKNVCVIDASTAHRCDPDWVYGFPEIGNTEKIAGSKRIANPGCHATGFISTVYPLVKNGLLPKDALLSCFSLTGYTGGGRSMINTYESNHKEDALNSPCVYAIGQHHKHIPEMMKVCGLGTQPIFLPVVDDYAQGMATTVMLQSHQLNKKVSADELVAMYDHFYSGCQLISVSSILNTPEKIYANQYAGKDTLQVIVAGNGEQISVTALFDNLGKGAAGAAIQNMNIVLGLDQTTGLVL